MSTGLDIAIPHSWSWSPLKFVTTYLDRGTAPDYIDDGPIRAISQASNQAFGFDWQRTRFHDYNGDPRRLKGYLLPGDVLVNSTGNGTLGRVGYFTEGPDEIPCAADGHVTVVRADEYNVDPRYMYYWLSSTPFQDYIYAALVVGATNQIELYRERLAGAPIPVPPVEEQRRIADFLDAEISKIDTLISLRSLQDSTLGEREAAWRSHLFLASKSGVWIRVKHLLRSKPRYGVLVPEFVDDGVPFIRVANLSDLTNRNRLATIAYGLSAQYARTVTMINDVLITVVGGTIGKTAIVPEDIAGANVARAIAVLRLNPKHASSLFTTWVETPEFMQQVHLATEADSAQPTLGMEDLANFSVRWPADYSEERVMTQTAHEHQLDTAAVHATLNRQLALLGERRQALISAAVTGGISI